MITHLLPDRPEFLSALERVGRVVRLVAIPYSIDSESLHILRQRYDVRTPTLDELRDRHYLAAIVAERIDNPLVVLEIGGYVANALPTIAGQLGSNFVGVVEDTEAGHRRYERLEALPVPVVSVARSRVKRPEDALVGLSCVFSIERLLRQSGLILEPRRALVMGYGPVGRGVAHALRDRRCFTSVYESDPIRHVQALAEGFATPTRDRALEDAQIVFGATANRSLTGEDFFRLPSECIIVSCSSRDAEFDVAALNELYEARPLSAEITAYSRAGQNLYLIAEGKPVNFLDGAVIGPTLALTQGLLLAAISDLLALHHNGVKKVVGIEPKTETLLAKMWLEAFRDPTTGFYRSL